MHTYAVARPYLFHLTHRANVDFMRETASLLPAAILMERGGRNDLLRSRRSTHVSISVGGRVVWLRDQGPLHEGNAKLSKGYTFEDLIESLNRRIFFWPGTAVGPISYGKRHFERYEEEKPVILRIHFDTLVQANPGAMPRYCRYNSGSPRCSNGKKSPRGPDTFVPADEFNHSPSKVVEVTFDTEILLPTNTEFGQHPEGPWKKLL